MNECRKIEDVLWRYDQMNLAEREMVDKHLAQCANCRAALETIRALGTSSQMDKSRLADFSAEQFDATVMRRIRSHQKSLAHPVFVTPRYSARMAFSFALAAMVVLVLVKSVSDLQDSVLPLTQMGGKISEADKYGLINLELKPAEKTPDTKKAGVSQSEPPSIAAVPKSESQPSSPVEKQVPISGREAMNLADAGKAKLSEIPESAKKTRNDTLSIEAPTMAMVPPTGTEQILRDDSRLRSARSELMDMAPSKDKAAEQQGVFSILTGPLSSPAPDSISIDAVFVTDENILRTQQSRAAALAEVYTDTGAMQPGPTQSSVLVTVEKMPVAIKMGMPDYPVWAKKQGLSGTVWIRARIDIAGRVSEAEVMSCEPRGAGFEDAALAAAKESRFVPASSNGNNLAVWIVYPVKFIYKTRP